MMANSSSTALDNISSKRLERHKETAQAIAEYEQMFGTTVDLTRQDLIITTKPGTRTSPVAGEIFVNGKSIRIRKPC